MRRGAPRTSRSTRLDGGLLLPGFVDTHVHYPQMRAIGGLGMPLLDWLERCALPEEAKLADRAYAARGGGGVPRRPDRLRHHHARWCSGRTSPAPWTSCSPRPSQRGLNLTSGLVLSDRILRPDLL